jgi:hypothetical protein
MLPASIAKKITGLDGRIKFLSLAEGLAWVLGFVAVSAIVTFLIDYLTPLPVLGRVVLDLLVLSGLAYLFFTRIVRALSGGLARDRLALLVEREYPELKDALISTVQLSPVMDDPAENVFQSTELIRSLVEETTARVKALNFRRAGRSSNLGRTWLIAALVILAFVLLASSSSASMGIYLNRFLLFTGEWPKFNQIVIHPDHPLPERIARGEDLAVTLLSTGREIPSKVYVYSRPLSGGEWEFSNTEQFAGGVFKLTFHNAVEPFEFYAVGGDNTTGIFGLDVTARPTIKNVILSFDYPGYLISSGYAGPATLEQGSARLPAGTKIHFNVHTNKPVKRAELVGPKNLDGDNVFEGDRLVPSGGVTSISGSFLVEKSMSYYFQLIDEYDFDSGGSPVKYTITAIPDSPPKVKFTKPGQNKDYTANAEVPIVIEATDDHGIEEMLFHYHVLTQGVASEKGNVTTISCEKFESGSSETKLTHAFTFHIENLSLTKGDVIVYNAEARDFRPDRKAGSRASETYRITIIDTHAAGPRISEYLRSITNKLKMAYKLQQANKRFVYDNVISVIEKTGKYGDKPQSETQHAWRQQNKVTKKLRDAQREFENLIEFAESNKVITEHDRKLYTKLRDVVGDLGWQKSPDVVAYLKSAHGNAADEEALPKIKDAETVQGRILDELKRLIKDLDQWEGIYEVQIRLKQIINLEEWILDRVLKSAVYKRILEHVDGLLKEKKVKEAMEYLAREISRLKKDSVLRLELEKRLKELEKLME